jgi:DNA-binding transcriptional LysR family regulator
VELNELRYFLAMARELNFTRAAASCAVSQPALTRAIQKLEAEFGGPLFVRQPRAVELTRLGRELLPFVEEAMLRLDAARDHALAHATTNATSLRLGVMCTVTPLRLVPLLEQLKARHPGITVQIYEATAKKIVDLVLSDDVDVALAAWPTYPDTVSVQPLFQERYVLAMRPDHPLAEARAVPIAAMEGCQYLERLSCEFDNFYAAKFGEWKIDLDVCFASEREDWIQALILAGQGCAVVPEYMDVAPGVIKRPLTEPEVARDVSLLTMRGRRLPEAALAFLRLASRHDWRT